MILTIGAFPQTIGGRQGQNLHRSRGGLGDVGRRRSIWAWGTVGAAVQGSASASSMQLGVGQRLRIRSRELRRAWGAGEEASRQMQADGGSEWRGRAAAAPIVGAESVGSWVVVDPAASCDSGLGSIGRGRSLGGQGSRAAAEAGAAVGAAARRGSRRLGDGSGRGCCCLLRCVCVPG